MKARATFARIGILTLLLFYLGSPVFLSLDPWDAFPDSGDTAIIVLWATALCLGAAILVAAHGISLILRGVRPRDSRPLCPDSPSFDRFHLSFRSRSPKPLRI